LVNNENKQYIQLRSTGSNTFQTVSPITAGTRFKMEIKNETECYIYIFGQEKDGSSYVLFPYLKPGETTSKHSPYCGITGYRLFPREQSMEADTIGNRDYIAIVVSKDELNYDELNKAISNSSQSTYAAKVNEALQSILIPSARYSGTGAGTIYFKVDANSNKAVAAIVAFDKQ
ncbi:MAG TPA: peptidase C1A papain, partial [Chitinophagaceae bacterium]